MAGCGAESLRICSVLTGEKLRLAPRVSTDSRLVAVPKSGSGRLCRKGTAIVTLLALGPRCPASPFAPSLFSRVGGQRLVYGGHTIGLALAQAGTLLPNLVAVLGWHSCDHTGPVHEGDTLYSDLHIEAADPLPGDRGGVLTLRSVVYAVADDGADREVLDWRFTALHF